MSPPSNVLIAALVLLPLVTRAADEREPASQPVDQKEIKLKTLALPVQFEENRGQFDSSVQYFSLGLGHRFLLRRSGMEFTFGMGTDKPQSVTMRLVGANPSKMIEGTDRLPGMSNYYRGSDPKLWLKGMPRFGRVRVGEVYPGIDVEYYGQGGLLEYDFVLRPGADPKSIRMAFQGARTTHTGPEGDLLIGLGDGLLRQRKPLVYQVKDGVRQEVACQYSKRRMARWVWTLPNMTGNCR